MKTFVIDERKVNVLCEGSGGPLFMLGVFAGEEEYVGDIFRIVREMVPGRPFTLAAYETRDWDMDFSPWKSGNAAEGIDGIEAGPGDTAARLGSFGGGGPVTLKWLSEALNGDLRRFVDTGGVFICGYSLSGLFSLWSVYASNLFDGCACCSGSLWYEGWIEFASSHKLQKPGIVYLSLGGKEEKSPNPVMATIGGATRSQDKILDQDANVIRHTLVMNPGGHFASTDKRVAKGIAWLIENRKK